MTTQQRDLTIDEAMADPLIRKVMKADRVEPRHLESMLRTLASVRAPTPGIALSMANVPPRFRPSSVCGAFCS